MADVHGFAVFFDPSEHRTVESYGNKEYAFGKRGKS
jgi:hypothetical protein